MNIGESQALEDWYGNLWLRDLPEKWKQRVIEPLRRGDNVVMEIEALADERSLAVRLRHAVPVWQDSLPEDVRRAHKSVKPNEHDVDIDVLLDSQIRARGEVGQGWKIGSTVSSEN